MGITVTVTCVSEAPAFFCTGWLLRKLGINRVGPLSSQLVGIITPSLTINDFEMMCLKL
jgi:hypothetical protein